MRESKFNVRKKRIYQQANLNLNKNNDDFRKIYVKCINCKVNSEKPNKATEYLENTGHQKSVRTRTQ